MALTARFSKRRSHGPIVSGFPSPARLRRGWTIPGSSLKLRLPHGGHRVPWDPKGIAGSGFHPTQMITNSGHPDDWTDTSKWPPTKICGCYPSFDGGDFGRVLGSCLFPASHRCFPNNWGFPEIGVPPVIIHFSRIFPHKNHLFLGTPMTSWKSPIGKDVSIACTLLVFSMVTTCDNNSTSKARLPFFSWLSWSFARLNMVYDGYIYTYQHISK